MAKRTDCCPIDATGDMEVLNWGSLFIGGKGWPAGEVTGESFCFARCGTKPG